MKKKEQAETPQQEPGIFVFDAAEDELKQNSVPIALVTGEKRPSHGSNRLEGALNEHLRRNSFNAHALKQNFFKKQSNQEHNIQYENMQIEPSACSVVNTKEMNELCQSIFIAEDQEYSIDFDHSSALPQKKKSIHELIEDPFVISVIEPEEKIITQRLAQVGDLDDLNSPVLFEQTRMPITSKFEEITLNEDGEQEELSQPEIVGLQIDRENGKRIVEITNKSFFVSNPIPPGILLNCKMRRSRDFLNFVTPEYDFFLDCGLKHIVSAQKKTLSSKEAFIISTQLGAYHRDTIVGSLKTNVVRDQFLLTSKEEGKQTKYQHIYCGINYGKLAKDNKVQRDMKAILPMQVGVCVRSDNVRNFTFDSISKKKKLILFRKKQSDNPSQKNFELVDEQDDQYIYLKLVKESKNVFNIAIQHPLSPLQAFGIVLTRFDAQLK